MVDNFSDTTSIFDSLLAICLILMAIFFPIFIGSLAGAVSHQFVFKKFSNSEKRPIVPSLLIAGVITFIIAFLWFSQLNAVYEAQVAYRAFPYAHYAPAQMETHHELVKDELLRQYRLPPGKSPYCHSENPDICRLAKWLEICISFNSNSDYCISSGKNLTLVEFDANNKMINAWIRFLKYLLLFGILPSIVSVMILKRFLTRNS